MVKNIIIKLATGELESTEQFAGEHNATTITFDYTGCNVDSWAKWVIFKLPNDTVVEPISLGTNIIETYTLPQEFLVETGTLQVYAYAIDGVSGARAGFGMKRLLISASLPSTGAGITYDPTQMEQLETSISGALTQINTIWLAYNNGELDGADGVDGIDGINGVDGIDGATPISVTFVGNDMVFTKDDATTITLVGAKLSLKGNTGATGDTGLTGASIISAAFVGNDLVFTKSDTTTVTLVGAKLALKGDRGIQGIQGEKGDTGSIADLGGVISGLPAKTTPVDADSFVISDSASANVEKKLSWANIKSTLKSYFDTLYNNYVHPANHPASIITQDASNRFVTDTEKSTWNSKANGTHSHLTSDVTGLDTALAGKAESAHTHTIANVTGLQTALDGKQATLTAGYGDTLNPYASKTAKHFLAAPNAAAGVPSFRAIVASDIPTLNQNTTGTASNVTGTVAIANGGTGATTAATALTNLGITATAAELNKLGGMTATTVELNYVAGVTSSIQTQLNAKAPLASPTFTGTVSGITAAMVGLGNVTNESKATMFSSPAFTTTATVAGRTIISNNVSTGTAVTQIWSGTQAQYDAIGTKDANTLYFIV